MQKKKKKGLKNCFWNKTQKKKKKKRLKFCFHPQVRFEKKTMCLAGGGGGREPLRGVGCQKARLRY